MDDKKRIEELNGQLLNEALPVITEIVNDILNDVFKGEMKFTLFLTNGQMCGLAGNNGLEHTFEHLKEIMERHQNGESTAIDMGIFNETKH